MKLRAFFWKYRGLLGFGALTAIFLVAVVSANATNSLEPLWFLAGCLILVFCALVAAGFLHLAITARERRMAREAVERAARVQQDAECLAQEVEDWSRSDPDRRKLFYGDPQYLEPSASERSLGKSI